MGDELHGLFLPTTLNQHRSPSRSEADIPDKQRAHTDARSVLDAFWLYKLTPQFNLCPLGQNLLATDTVRQRETAAAGNVWQLNSADRGYRMLLVTLEERW